MRRMQMPFPFTMTSGVDLDLRFTRQGLWLIVSTALVVAPVEGSLLLKWPELAIVIGAVVAGFIAVNFRGAIASTWLISEWAPQHLWAAATIIAASALTIGLLLAYWKRRQLLLYGVFEVLFGALTTLQVGLTLWPNGETSKFVAIGSALYVISRGAGNVADAFKKEALLERLRLKVSDTDILREVVANT
jgi:hypothetical protein